QSPRAWFGRFSKSMKNFGYKQSNSDHTLFLKHKKGKVTALIVYVDDMVVTKNDLEEKWLIQNKEYFYHNGNILDILTNTGMLASKTIDISMELNHQFGEYPDQVPTNKERYQRIVGKLIYLGRIRPNMVYAVSVVSQFMHAPSEAYMDAENRILRYLKSALGRGLMVTLIQTRRVFVTDRPSTSGYFTFVGSNLKVVSISSVEVEYRGMAHGVYELLWIRNLLGNWSSNPNMPCNSIVTTNP
ncbi:ABC-2 type transporter family protein, partial [Prunus dulcis]